MINEIKDMEDGIEGEDGEEEGGLFVELANNTSLRIPKG